MMFRVRCVFVGYFHQCLNLILTRGDVSRCSEMSSYSCSRAVAGSGLACGVFRCSVVGWQCKVGQVVLPVMAATARPELCLAAPRPTGYLRVTRVLNNFK